MIVGASCRCKTPFNFFLVFLFFVVLWPVSKMSFDSTTKRESAQSLNNNNNEEKNKS